jgi:hypothetical protein
MFKSSYTLILTCQIPSVSQSDSITAQLFYHISDGIKQAAASFQSVDHRYQYSCYAEVRIALDNGVVCEQVNDQVPIGSEV